MNNYIQSFYPALPGSEIGNMTAFSSAVSPQFVTPTLVANNANRKKLIEQRSKKTVDKSPSTSTSTSTSSVDAKGNKYSPSLIDQVLGGFRMGGQAYGNVFSGRPIMTGIDQIRDDVEKGIVRDSEGNVTHQGNESGDIVEVEQKDEDDIFTKRMKEYTNQNLQLLDKVGDMAEKARDRNMLRAGIMDLAGSPLIGGQAALEAAKNVGTLTLGNMGAMAAQNRVLEANPVKNRFAGRYFR
jgi:hypothetical protein